MRFAMSEKGQVIEFKGGKGVRFAQLPLLQLQIAGLGGYVRISRCASSSLSQHGTWGKHGRARITRRGFSSGGRVITGGASSLPLHSPLFQALRRNSPPPAFDRQSELSSSDVCPSSCLPPCWGSMGGTLVTPVSAPAGSIMGGCLTGGRNFPQRRF